MNKSCHTSFDFQVEQRQRSNLDKMDFKTGSSFLIPILLGLIPHSYQWGYLGTAASSMKNTVMSLPDQIGAAATALDSLFVNRNPEDVIFEFYPSKGVLQVIDIHDPTSVLNSNYNRSRPTVLITHGFTPDFAWMGGSNTVFGYIADAYWKVGAELNLIAVNWEALARPRGLLKPLHYGSVVKVVPIVGNRVAEFIVYLKQNAGLELNNLHLIGFSLGAHVSGLAGSGVKNMTGELVHRITGLDAASPEFEGQHIEDRLDDSDGKFVEAVHTNIKANGIWNPIGHVDFYPYNGGPIQPACSITSSIFGASYLWRLVCSHSQAYRYYAESILRLHMACPCDSISDFYACEKAWDKVKGKCENPIPFGDRCPETGRGIYFVRTLKAAGP